MKSADVKQKSKADLEEVLREKRARAEELSFLLRQKKVKNVRELREVKRDIARILTALRSAS